LLKAQLLFNIVPIFNLLPSLNKSMHSYPVKVTHLPLRSSAHSILLCLVLTRCLPKGQTVKNLKVWDQEYRWVQQHCPSKFFQWPRGFVHWYVDCYCHGGSTLQRFTLQDKLDRFIIVSIQSSEFIVVPRTKNSQVTHTFHPKQPEPWFFLAVSLVLKWSFHGPSQSSAVLASVSLFLLTHHETVVTLAVWANVHA
jgi:hypothetical protein